MRPISLDFPAGAEQCMHDRSKQGNKGVLVEEALAGNCAAQAGDTIVAANLALELVIVGELLVWMGC